MNITDIRFKISSLLHRIANKIYPEKQHYTPEAFRVIPWYQADGDNTLRLDYDLSEQSVVMDLGGYHGDWTGAIYDRYKCNIHVFEPYTLFAEIIRDPFKNIPEIKTHTFGLGNRNADMELRIDGVSTSMFKRPGDKGKYMKAMIVNATDFFNQERIGFIDLMKINIEGGEYDLLEHLIDTGYVKKIDNIQVQFHDFIQDAENRMKLIQEKLHETHSITYQFPFVWENWKLKK